MGRSPELGPPLPTEPPACASHTLREPQPKASPSPTRGPPGSGRHGGLCPPRGEGRVPLDSEVVGVYDSVCKIHGWGVRGSVCRPSDVRDTCVTHERHMCV